MPRYLSFRFDDGFLTGARKAAALLAPNRASFFIVTGLVAKSHDLSHIPQFVGREFGTLQDWMAMARQGHDIQPHSISHQRLPELSKEDQTAEVQGSLSFVQKIHAGPYVFCHPYNMEPDVDWTSLGLSAAGFVTRRSLDGDIVFNRVDPVDPFRLRSWVVWERDFDRVIEQLETNVEDSGWVILAFHSLDGEGYNPWSSERFAALVKEVRKFDYEIETVGAMIKRFVDGGAAARPAG